MTPLPAALDGTELIGWRLDREKHALTRDSGEGAFQVVGHRNSAGVRAVFCALDPATTILEVAVHKGFKVLDTDPHVLTSFRFDAGSAIRIVQTGDVPDANWLRPGSPSAGQQNFGNNLLVRYAFVVVLSVVSAFSWNLAFVAASAASRYHQIEQEPFALDPQLNELKKI